MDSTITGPTIHCGWMRERTSPQEEWKIRHFVLYQNGWLVSFPKKLDGTEILMGTVYTAKDCQIIIPKFPGHNSMIAKVSLTGVATTICLETHSAEERQEWLQALSSVCTSQNCIARQDYSKLKDFDFLNVLYQGNYSKTRLCRNRNNSKFYAAKIFARSDNVNLKDIAKEKRLLKKFDHPFIVKLHYSFDTESHVYLITDFVQGGTLAAHLEQEQTFSEDKARFYAAEIALALTFLHVKQIIHRDIKLENVLLDRDGHIKLTDFGICKENAVLGDNINGFCGSMKYMPPEMLEDGICSFATDWWALGVIIFKMLCGYFPFSSEAYRIRYGRMVMNSVRIPWELSDEARYFLADLLNKVPDFRLGGGPMGSQEVLLHSWFASINWDDLHNKQVLPPFKPELESASDLRHYMVGYEPETAAEDITSIPVLVERLKDVLCLNSHC